MPLNESDVRTALSRLEAPGQPGPLAGSPALRSIAVRDAYVIVRLHLLIGEQARIALASSIARALQATDPASHVIVEYLDDEGSVIDVQKFQGQRPQGATPPPQQGANTLKDVSHVIAVGAGKGGVGKSTVAVNLAVALARKNHAVGILDGDIYGPSLPTLLGLDPLEQVVHAGMLQPFAVHRIKAITIGKLVEPDKPLIWRGPKAHAAFSQLVTQTQWGELDYLVIDLPPGTGDVALTMAQAIRLTGAVIVCTPQKVAQDDASRAIAMFQQLGVEILGIVENMSHFVGDDGTVYDLFGRGGARNLARRLGVPFLGEIPLTMALRRNSDAGDPSANFDDPPLADAINAIADNVQRHAAILAAQRRQPTLSIS